MHVRCSVQHTMLWHITAWAWRAHVPPRQLGSWSVKPPHGAHMPLRMATLGRHDLSHAA